MRRPRQHVMEDEAEHLIRGLLPSEWIIRTVESDYGVDFEIELVDEELVTGNRIWVQSKAVERSKRCTKDFGIDGDGDQLRSEYLPFSIETRELFYALRCPFPLLLFLADLESQDVFWLPLQDEIKVFLDPERPKWRSQATTTVRVPVRNSLHHALANDYDLLRWFAKQPARTNAFVQIHWMLNEFSYKGNLGRYKIGNGVIHGGAQVQFRQSVELAHRYLSDALALDVLFDGKPGPFLFTAGQVQQAIDAADSILVLLNSQQFLAHDIELAIDTVEMGMTALQSVSSSIEVWREQSVISRLATVIYGS